MENLQNVKSIKKKRFTAKTKFLIVMLLFPMAQFILFYFGVNFNSLLLSIQKYENGKFVISGFEQYVKVFKDIFINGNLSVQIKNSAIMLGVNMLICLPLNVFVAFCVWKKLPFSGFFKVILFLPNVISGIVFVLVARYLLDWGLPTLLGNPDMTSLLNTNSNTGFITVMIFGVWLGFSSGMVVYLSAMSSISIDVVEYSKLEPINFFQEFIHIVVPSIFPTITTYTLTTVAGFFTNYGFLFSFFGGGATTNQVETLGYRFFVILASNSAQPSDYPYCAAAGLFFSMIVGPIVLSIKYMMERFGPSEE